MLSSLGQRVARSPRAMMIDVVIDEYGNVKGLLNVSGDIESVPSRHDRRAGRLSGGVFYRTGQPDADSDDVRCWTFHRFQMACQRHR